MAKSDNTWIFLLIAVVAIIFFFSHSNTLFSVISFPQAVNGTFKNVNWAGGIDLKTNDACSSASLQISNTSISLAASSINIINQCGNGEGVATLEGDFGNFSTVQIDFTSRSASSPYGSQCRITGGVGVYILGIGYSQAPPENCASGIVSKSGTIKFVHNSQNRVDVFLKECSSCNDQYLGTSDYSGKIRLSANAGTTDSRSSTTESIIITDVRTTYPDLVQTSSVADASFITQKMESVGANTSDSDNLGMLLAPTSPPKSIPLKMVGIVVLVIVAGLFLVWRSNGK